MPFPKFDYKPEQAPAKTAKPLNTPVGHRPERDSAPSLDTAPTKPDTNPWQEALEQADPLAARLVELGAPVLRVDVDGRARGYRPLKGLAPQQVHQVVRWTFEALAREYPTPTSLAVIAQWPGAYPRPIANTRLWCWSAEHQPAPEPEAPQLADWAAALLEDADRLGVAYPVLLVLLDPEPETQSLTRLCKSRHHLERVLGELSRYTPREARLLKPGTLEPLLELQP